MTRYIRWSGEGNHSDKNPPHPSGSQTQVSAHLNNWLYEKNNTIMIYNTTLSINNIMWNIAIETNYKWEYRTRLTAWWIQPSDHRRPPDMLLCIEPSKACWTISSLNSSDVPAARIAASISAQAICAGSVSATISTLNIWANALATPRRSKSAAQILRTPTINPSSSNLFKDVRPSLARQIRMHSRVSAFATRFATE